LARTALSAGFSNSAGDATDQGLGMNLSAPPRDPRLLNRTGVINYLGLYRPKGITGNGGRPVVGRRITMMPEDLANDPPVGQNINYTTQAKPANAPPAGGQLFSQIFWTALDLVVRFSSSGVFFMIIGAILLREAYETVGKTHSAISFVFVVTGVAILLFGTGTQGIGRLDTGQDMARALQYQAVLAGGAGVIAFCVAAGMIAFPNQIKMAFLPSQSYIRLLIDGDSGFPRDLDNYRLDAIIDGTRVPTVQHENHIEIFAPFLPTSGEKSFNLVLRLQAVAQPDPRFATLLPSPEGSYPIVIRNDQTVLLNGKAAGKYSFDATDFPQYNIPDPIKIAKPPVVDGEIVR
jgi:hypothetical protein